MAISVRSRMDRRCFFLERIGNHHACVPETLEADKQLHVPVHLTASFIVGDPRHACCGRSANSQDERIRNSCELVEAELPNWASQ